MVKPFQDGPSIQEHTANALRLKLYATFVLIYVISVLLIDSLALRRGGAIDWSVFRWQLDNGFDLFKFIAWFAIPVAVSLPFLDLHYFTFRRWKRLDWYLLGIVVLGGAIVMLLLPVLPGVGEYYRGWGGLPVSKRLDYVQYNLLWTLSWLLGWEFMHRYWLLRHIPLAWPRWGVPMALVIVPLLEAVYHLIQTKPPLEALAMGGLSVVLCAWTLRRKNTLLPFLAHFAIELELIVFLFFRP
jgi:membrane protease YdiL (CAAX protease family)